MLPFYGKAFSCYIVEGVRRSSTLQREIVTVVFIWQKRVTRTRHTYTYNDSLVNKQDRQCTIVAVEKHKYYIFRVCLCVCL